MWVGPFSTLPWSVQTSAALPPRSITIEIESARSRLPPLTLQKMPLVQIPPTCITPLEAEVWLTFGTRAVPFVVWANVTDHGDCSASVGVKSGELSQMKSTRPVDPAAIHGKKCVPLSLFTFTGGLQLTALLLEWLNQMSNTLGPLRLSGNTEYTLPATPFWPESSTASVAKMSSVFVPGPPSNTWCASQIVSPPADAGGECATQTWWKFWICVMLQPIPMFAAGSAVIHCT